MKAQAERCMSFFEEHKGNEHEWWSKWRDLDASIHKACEKLKEIALDFIEERRPMTLEEAEGIERLIESQEREFCYNLYVIFNNA